MALTFVARLISLSENIATVETAFGEPADNSVIVQDAIQAIASLSLAGGQGVKFTGPMSIPAAFAICHAVAHRFGFVACYDPKLMKFVVTISHDPAFRPGDLID